MEDRGYIAQALFDRLRDAGIAFCVLGDRRGYPESAPAEIEIALPRAALEGMPGTMARFCQDFDLQLVQLERADGQSWRFVFSWSNDIGRPRYITVTVLSDYWRGGRRLLRGAELLAVTAEVQFIHGLIDAAEREHLDDARALWLAELWEENPRGAMERVMRFWPQPADGRLIAQAARHGEWGSIRAHLPRLRRAMRRAVRPSPGELAARLALAVRRAFQPARARIAFTGRESSLRGRVMIEVARDLAPLGLTLCEDRLGEARRADFRVVFDGPKGLEREFDDVVAIEGDLGLPAMVAETERAILRWLECRVERRYPDATVGENPRTARLLQFLCRIGLSTPFQTFLNCAVHCRIRSPILMPYPFGIVIERGAIIGSRVTVMQQATIGRKDAADSGAPIIEDNVCIGAGARILGPVRVGRGATVGANAVVTRDVPSHCTVVGANRILAPGERPPVAAQRREDHETVVNT